MKREDGFMDVLRETGQHAEEGSNNPCVHSLRFPNVPSPLFKSSGMCLPNLPSERHQHSGTLGRGGHSTSGWRFLRSNFHSLTHTIALPLPTLVVQYLLCCLLSLARPSSLFTSIRLLQSEPVFFYQHISIVQQSDEFVSQLHHKFWKVPPP